MTDYYVDPLTGSSSNPGTSKGSAFASLADLDGASLNAGDNIYLVAEAGSPVTDSLTARVKWDTRSGTLGSPITITTYDGNTTAYQLDWSAGAGNQNDGIVISNSDYFHITADTLSRTAAGGLALLGVDDNAIILENFSSTAHGYHRLENLWLEDYGNSTPSREGNGVWLKLNTVDCDIINCRFRDGSAYRDSDGVYVGGNSTLQPGGHYFEEVVCEYNADDGFDFYRSDPNNGSVLVDCVARYNGRDLFTWNSGDETGGVGNWGDGNGFKMGGDLGGDNVCYRCVSYWNRGRNLGGAGSPNGDGFDDNGSTGNYYFNCTSHANERYGFQASGGASLFINNVAHSNGAAPVTGTRSDENNSWDTTGVSVSDADFTSVDPDDYGSGYLVPASGSELVDAGVELDGYLVDFDSYSGGSAFTIDVSTLGGRAFAETFTGTAPDLGATEASGAGTTNDAAGLIGSPGFGLGEFGDGNYGRGSPTIFATFLDPAESASFDTDVFDSAGVLSATASLFSTETETFIPTGTEDSPIHIGASLSTPFYFGYPETVGTATSFPTDGLVARYEADDGVTTTGSTVTAWDDLTGNGNDLTANGDPQLDTTAPNGAASIELDGAGDYFDTTSFSLPSGDADRTVVFFGRYDEQGCVGVSWGTASTGQVYGLRVDQVTDNLELQLWGPNDREATGSDGVDGEFLTQTTVLDAEQLTHYDDRGTIDTWNGDGLINTGTTRMTVGAEIDLSPDYDMAVSAIFIYDRALSSSELEEVWDYIDQKYRYATTDTLLDDMEVDNTAAWYDGEDFEFVRSDTRSYAGTYAYRGDGDAGAIWWDDSAGELPNDGTQDGRAYVWVFNGDDAGLLFMQDPSGTSRADLDGYEARLNLGSTDRVQLLRWDTFTETELDSQTITGSDWQEDWVEVRVNVNDGEITATFTNTEDATVDPITLTATDSNKTTGRLGFQHGTSQPYYDNLGLAAPETNIAASGTDDPGQLAATAALVGGAVGLPDDPGYISADASFFVSLDVPVTDAAGRIVATPSLIDPDETRDAIEIARLLIASDASLLELVGGALDVALTDAGGVITAVTSLLEAEGTVAQDIDPITVAAALRQSSPTTVGVDDPGYVSVAAALRLAQLASIANDDPGQLAAAVSLLADEGAAAADDPGTFAADASLIPAGSLGVGDNSGVITATVSFVTSAETFPLIATAILLGHFGDPSELDGFMYDGSGDPLE